MPTRRHAGLAVLLVAAVIGVSLLLVVRRDGGSGTPTPRERGEADQPGAPRLRGTDASSGGRPPDAEEVGGEQELRVAALLRSFSRARDDEADGLARELIALGADAAPVLIRALDDEDRRVRAASALILGHIRSEDAIPHLVAQFGDTESLVRGHAAEALGQIGKPAVPSIVPCLDHAEPHVRASAAVALWTMDQDAEPALAHLLSALEREKDDDAFSRICWALTRCGPDASAAIPHLVSRLADASQSIAFSARDALGDMGPPAVGPLVEALRMAKTQRAAARAAFALGDLGDLASDAVPALLEALVNGESHLRRAASDALGRIGSEPASVVPALTKALADRSSRVRTHAAQALFEFGPDAASAVPDLLGLLRDPDDDVANAAVSVMGAIGPAAAAAVPHLIPRLSGDGWSTRASAMIALRGIGPDGREAASLLSDALSEKDLRAHAATALHAVDPGRFRVESDRALPALLDALHVRDQELRVSAVQAIASLGASATSALPVVRSYRDLCRDIERGEDTEFDLGSAEEVADFRAALEKAIRVLEGANGGE